MDISLYDRCELYLLKNNIELEDERYTDRRLGIEGDIIYKWEFPLMKPTLEELNKLTTKDIEQLQKRKEKKMKLKKYQKFDFPILNDEDLITLSPYDGLIYINEKDGSLYYYYKNKLQKVRVFEGV